MAPTPPTPSNDDELGASSLFMGRRRLLQWSTAAVGAGALGILPDGADSASASSGSTRHHGTASADSLVEAMGVRINAQLAAYAYGHRAAMRDAVDYLGLRYAREETVLPSFNRTMASNQAKGWSMLASVGCRILTIMAHADGSRGSVAELAAYHKSTFGGDTGGVLWGIENANEWNGRRGSGIGAGVSPLTGKTYSHAYPLWAEELAIWQHSMWHHYKADPHLDGLAIVGPALVNATPGNSQVLVDVANAVLGGSTGLQPYTTYSNYHVYCGQAARLGELSVPSWHLDQKVSAMKVQAPQRPWVCSEAGMHNALNSPNTDFSPHSKRAAAIYAPRMTLEHVLRGTHRQWFFGLVDERPDPHRTDQENEFGLFNHDWTPKPAARALKRMVHLFSDPGPAFTPKHAHLTVSGHPGMRLHSLRFRKRNGTTLLALWRDVSVWDYLTQSDLHVPAQTAQVTMRKPRNVRMYRPSIKHGVYAHLGRGVRDVHVPVAGDVVVLAIA